MNLAQLKGTFVALYTPFKGDGSVDLSSFESLASRLVAHGIGLVPCGTTGETPALSVQEYEALVRCAVEVADGQVPVIAGTGSNSTRHTIDNTRRARELGVDAALVVTPYYNKPPQDALQAHFAMVADEGGLPVVLYNVPGRTGVNMAAATSLQLAQHPNIVAIKEASGSLDQFHALLEGAPESFSVLSGDDAWTLPLMLLGGHGVVSVAGNVAPAAMTAMVQAAQEGRLAQARDLHFRMLPLFDALFATTNPIPVKQAAAILGHAEAGVRAPLQGASFDSALAVRLREALQRVLGAPVS